jgi:hypothetical protein
MFGQNPSVLVRWLLGLEFLGWLVVMSQGKGGGAFAIGGGSVARLLLEAGQAKVGDERRGFLGF